MRFVKRQLEPLITKTIPVYYPWAAQGNNLLLGSSKNLLSIAEN